MKDGCKTESILKAIFTTKHRINQPSLNNFYTRKVKEDLTKMYHNTHMLQKARLSTIETKGLKRELSLIQSTINIIETMSVLTFQMLKAQFQNRVWSKVC